MSYHQQGLAIPSKDSTASKETKLVSGGMGGGQRKVFPMSPKHRTFLSTKVCGGMLLGLNLGNL